MILSDADIRQMVEWGALVVEPFDPERVQPASLDVTLAAEFRVFDSQVEVIDPLEQQALTRLVTAVERPFILHPGEFVLGSTVEHFTFPAHLAGQLSGKSSLGRMGLQVHATAGFFDPGFTGTGTLELSNVSNLPIRLHPGMAVAQMAFLLLSNPAERPYGSPGLGSKYHGQSGPVESRFHENRPAQ